MIVPQTTEKHHRTQTARGARIAAGLTTAAAAKRLRVSPRYLLRCERTGFPWVLADRAARLYACPIDLLRNTLGDRCPGAGKGTGARRTPRSLREGKAHA